MYVFMIIYKQGEIDIPYTGSYSSILTAILRLCDHECKLLPCEFGVDIYTNVKGLFLDLCQA